MITFAFYAEVNLWLALEVFYENALYKFTFDIDIGISTISTAVVILAAVCWCCFKLCQYFSDMCVLYRKVFTNLTDLSVVSARQDS